MIRRLIVFALGAALAVACSLNPQPLPPGAASADPDAGVDARAGSDATVGPNQDAAIMDGGETDAATEAAPPGDAATDATSEAGDGSTDGAVDAQGD